MWEISLSKKGAPAARAMRSGFTLLETLVYLGVLALTATVVVAAAAGFGRLYRSVSAVQSLARSGDAAVERLLDPEEDRTHGAASEELLQADAADPGTDERVFAGRAALLRAFTLPHVEKCTAQRPLSQIRPELAVSSGCRVAPRLI